MSEAQPPDLPPIENRGWETLARDAARTADAGEGRDEVLQLLSFELDGAPYAVPVDRVREIVRMRSITPVPRVPEEVRGVISLRGEIIQVIDLRRRLGLAPIEATRHTRLIVARDRDGRAAAMLVDAVREVLRVGADAIRVTDGSDSGVVEALCDCGDRFVSMIELDRVLELHA